MAPIPPKNNKISGQNSTFSRALSSVSLTTPRVTYEVTITSIRPGIKNFLCDHFSKAKIFAKIRRTEPDTTKVTLQGHSDRFPAFLNHLNGLLQIQYDAAIAWNQVTTTERLSSITIEDTPAVLKREPSSGEFLQKEFEEISLGGSAATENFKKLFKETFANAAIGVGIANGLIPTVKEKHISFKYKDQRYALEVSRIESLEMLIHAVSKKIQIPQPIQLLYTVEDNDLIVVTDVKDLREGCLYYALTVNEELPKKLTEMEQFFERLKTDEDMSDAQVEIVKEAFSSQGITCKQLMKTGDLAITDGKLKEYGIAQGGLRTAILAVIKSNIQ